MADCNEGAGNEEHNEPDSTGGLYAYLEGEVKNLDPTSRRLPKLLKLVEELRIDEARRAFPCPAGGQQPYPLDKPRKRFSFRQILEWLRLVPKKTTQPESAIGEYQQRNVTHYGEAFNVDLGGSMIESEVENKRAYYNERQEELRQRYEGRPANFAGPLYDSEFDLVPKMLGAYKRRDQEYQWRQPGSQFRREVLECPELTITEETEESPEEHQIWLFGILKQSLDVLKVDDSNIAFEDISARMEELLAHLSQLNDLADVHRDESNKENLSAIRSLLKRFLEKIERLSDRGIDPPPEDSTSSGDQTSEDEAPVNLPPALEVSCCEVTEAYDGTTMVDPTNHQSPPASPENRPDSANLASLRKAKDGCQKLLDTLLKANPRNQDLRDNIKNLLEETESVIQQIGDENFGFQSDASSYYPESSYSRSGSSEESQGEVGSSAASQDQPADC